MSYVIKCSKILSQGPEITIECPDVNFGLVRFGENKKAVMPISNTSRVPTTWSISEAKANEVTH
jgi:hypothetical protein